MNQRIPSARRHAIPDAFTLVELLVVIGIIALLISILLPALNRARAVSQRTVCATQMREIVNATLVYAVENHGYLPEYPGYDKKSLTAANQYASGAGETQIAFYMASVDSPAVPTSPADQYASVFDQKFGVNGANIGRLFVRKYLRNPKIMLCPSLPEQTALGSPARPRSGYFFNPWPAYSGGSVSGGLGQPAVTYLTTRFKKVRDVKKELPIVTEFLYTSGSFSHFDLKNKTMYFNLAYTDGHVTTVNGKNTYNAILSRGEPGWSWSRTCDYLAQASYEGLGIGNRMMGGFGIGAAGEDVSKYYYSAYPKATH